MKRELLRSASYSLTAAILFAVAAASTSWANPADPVNPLKKRFPIGKGLDICDQGAFFVGGVPKVYEFCEFLNRGRPAAGHHWPVICSVPDPQQAPPVAADPGPWIQSHRGGRGCDAERNRRLAGTCGARQPGYLCDGSAGTGKIRFRLERHS